nr:chemotaxis protein CheW [Pseudenhygromyxa sp. WMMC2535]
MAPPAVCGLINLRGEIVPALDLRVCFGLAKRPLACAEIGAGSAVPGDEDAAESEAHKPGLADQRGPDQPGRRRDRRRARARRAQLPAAAAEPARPGAGADPRRPQLDEGLLLLLDAAALLASARGEVQAAEERTP